MSDPPPFRSGFVTVAGRPNVGKSTLVNRLTGEKVSIVSTTPHTTRTEIRGVVHVPPGPDSSGAQVVVVDTPGIHRPRTLLGERTNRRALEALGSVDVACQLIEASAPVGPGDRFVADALRRAGVPRFLVVNKVDRVDRATVLARLAEAQRELGDHDEFVPVSAQTGDGVDRLLALILDRLPPGPAYYPAGVLTDQPEAVLMAELVREQLLALTRDEVPHSIAVTVESIEERESGALVVEAVVRVERESQKGIVIGRDGGVLKRAGTAARRELERRFGVPVHLSTRVRVDRDWQRRAHSLERLGL